jgi:hypothetical protein
MPHQRSPKISVLSASVPFIAVFTCLIAFAAPGQHADTAQPSANSHTAAAPVQVSTPAQAPRRPLLLGAVSAQRVSAARLQGKKAAAAAPDSGGLI